MSSSSLRAAVPAALLVVLWSSGFVGAELGTAEAPAATLLAWRYLVAAAVLLLACGVRRERPTRTGARRQVVLGLLCQAGYLGFVVSAVGAGVPAGTAALVAALQPLVVVALAAAVLGERASVARLVGLVVGLAGVALVVAGDLAAGTAPWWAFLLPGAGMLSLAVGTVLEQRWGPGESLLVGLTVQTTTAAVVFWVVVLAVGGAAPPATVGFWTAVAWVVVLSSLGGYGAYVHVTRAQGATRASTLLYLTPPTTMLWSALMLGAEVTALGLAGVGVCAAGVAVALRASSPRAGSPDLRRDVADTTPGVVRGRGPASHRGGHEGRRRRRVLPPADQRGRELRAQGARPPAGAG